MVSDIGFNPLVGNGYFTALTNITPFTYRDNETYLSQLQRLCKWIDYVSVTLQAQIAHVQAEDAAAIAALAAQLNAALASLATQLNTELDQFSLKWENELLSIESQQFEFVFDPTSGSQIETVNTVISRVFDNLRYYAYFADQLDTFEFTAAEWDAYEYTARGFDLALAYSPTETQAVDTVPATVQPTSI